MTLKAAPPPALAKDDGDGAREEDADTDSDRESDSVVDPVADGVTVATEAVAEGERDALPIADSEVLALELSAALELALAEAVAAELTDADCKGEADHESVADAVTEPVLLGVTLLLAVVVMEPELVVVGGDEADTDSLIADV